MSDFLNYLSENMKTYVSAAAEEVSTVKAVPGRLFKLQIANVNAAARTVYIFDSAAADAGTLIIPPTTIPIGGTLSLDWGVYGKKFAAGMRIHSSSTFATFTASASADLQTSASFL